MTLEDPIVITGMGALTPVGNTAEDTWQSLLAGRSGVGPITHFDASSSRTQIAAEVKGFDPNDHLTTKEIRRTSRASQLAIVAAREAVADAGLPAHLSELEGSDGIGGSGVGIALNAAVSGFPEIQDATEALHSGGARAVSPSFVPAALTNMPACQVAMDLGVHGPVNASALACASGAYALIEGRRLLLSGEADVMIVGGTDTGITEPMFAGLGAMRALSPGDGDPTKVSRPFDADRTGFVFGEGAVVFTLERLSHARARGARVYSTVLGGALTSDAFHFVAPEPSGRHAAAAITRALSSSGIAASDVDLVVAHGTSTKANDKTETSAIRQALGEAADDIEVSGPKSMTGHLIGAAGALAGLVCARAIDEGSVPPTINLETPDPDCDLDYVPNEARESQVDIALTNAFGFGGQNCVVSFGRA
jgi:3-oxoacyl-[acyl-carrier-protein] synthase II